MSLHIGVFESSPFYDLIVYSPMSTRYGFWNEQYQVNLRPVGNGVMFGC